MCGIFGIIFHGEEHHGQHEDIAELFTSLAVESSIRGTDATGLARIEKDGYICRYRNVVPAFNIVSYRRWWRPLGNVTKNTMGLLGHTRWGTHGANVIENAHPFVFEGRGSRIVGIHNGMIGNYERFGPRPALDNDSANLYYGMAERTPDEWPDMLEDTTGSFALAWSDGKAMYLARNSSSPCVMTHVASLDATVFASTEDILKKGFLETKFQFGSIHHLIVGAIHKFIPGQLVPEVTRFATHQRYPGYANGWYGASEEWIWDEESHTYGPKQERKLLSSGTSKAGEQIVSEDDIMFICESCGKERDQRRMQFVPSLRGYECDECRGISGKCTWCGTYSTALRPSRLWKPDVLCLGCAISAGEVDEISQQHPRNSARVIECHTCGAEFNEGMENIHIFLNEAADEYECQDCIGGGAEVRS